MHLIIFCIRVHEYKGILFISLLLRPHWLCMEVTWTPSEINSATLILFLILSSTDNMPFTFTVKCWRKKSQELLESGDKQGHLPPLQCGGKSPVGQAPGPFSSLSESICFVLARSIQSGIVELVLSRYCQSRVQAFLTGTHGPGFLLGPSSMLSGPHLQQQQHTHDDSR